MDLFGVRKVNRTVFMQGAPSMAIETAARAAPPGTGDNGQIATGLKAAPFCEYGAPAPPGFSPLPHTF